MNVFKKGLCAMVVLSFMVMSTGTASAAKTFRFAGQNPVDQESTKQMLRIRDMVLKETKGGIELKVYPANQLGDFQQIQEELLKGTIDFALISTNHQLDGRLMLPSMMFLAKTYDDAKKIYAKNGVLYKIIDEACNDLGMKFLGFSAECMSGIASVKPLNEKGLLDPKVKKSELIRTSGIASAVYTLQDLGFRTVSVPYAETYTALQTGICDAWWGGGPIHNYSGFGDIIKHYYATNLFIEATCFFASNKAWNSLTAEQQKVIQNAINIEEKNSFVSAEKFDKLYSQKLHDEYGVTIHTFTPKELAPIFENGRNKTWEKLTSIAGKDAIRRLREEVKKLEK